jgi:hypothetical protein
VCAVNLFMPIHVIACCAQSIHLLIK